MIPQRNKAPRLLLLLIITTLVCALLCCHHAAFSTATREEVSALVREKPDRFRQLVMQSEGQLLGYNALSLGDRLTFFSSGLHQINGLYWDEGTDFWFRSQFLEGELHLYYCPSGDKKVLEHLHATRGIQLTAIPEGGICQNGMGIDKSGFIYCEKLQPQWYLVEWYLPT